MVVSIRMTEEERQLADSYAKLKGYTLSEAIKRAYFEKIEDEFDIVLAEIEINEYNREHKSYSHDEVKKMFDL